MMTEEGPAHVREEYYKVRDELWRLQGKDERGAQVD